MKLTAEAVYHKLLNEDKILEIQGQIKFYLGNVDIVVRQRDVVGNIMQEWLEGWLKKNNVEYSPNPNTQMPPDIFLDPENMTKELLEVKAFNYESSPGFDIADFTSFQNEIIEKPYMLHTKYLIFGYVMTEDGFVIIKDMWLKNIWEICRPMKNYPINLQIKENVIHKIRPAKWYAQGSSFKTFETLEDFISAIEETVYQNPKTHIFAGTWLRRFKNSYHSFYNKNLTILRWSEIENKYVSADK